MCKHQNGRLIEFMEAAHIREVKDGIIESDGCNEVGNITHYEYKCHQCEKTWRLSTLNPRITPMPKWLAKIVETFSSNHKQQ